MKMKILPPTLEKRGKGGFEMDGKPIESFYPKGEVWERVAIKYL